MDLARAGGLVEPSHAMAEGGPTKHPRLAACQLAYGFAFRGTSRERAGAAARRSPLGFHWMPALLEMSVQSMAKKLKIGVDSEYIFYCLIHIHPTSWDFTQFK